MYVDAKNRSFYEINTVIRTSAEDVDIDNCLGHRFIGAGLSDKKITVNGVPGNALGAYLNGAEITVRGNAQDAVGDTCNDGKIIVYGDCGDTVGYAMRGGEIYIKGNVGYRAGIHMKAYKDKLPVLVVGGGAGSFLGEYQAGGIIIVLGIGCVGSVVGNFTATGMHGGRIFLRGDHSNLKLAPQVCLRRATDNDINTVKRYIENYCAYFSYDIKDVFDEDYYVLTPNTKSPYKQMYVRN